MRSRVVKIDEIMYNIFNYASKQIQVNARIDKPAPLTRTTRILGEDCIVDGNTIIFRIPNGNHIRIRKRLRIT